MNDNQDDIFDVAGYLLHLEGVARQGNFDKQSVLDGLQEARNVLSRALNKDRAKLLERRAQLAALQAKYPNRPIITVAGE